MIDLIISILMTFGMDTRHAWGRTSVYESSLCANQQEGMVISGMQRENKMKHAYMTVSKNQCLKNAKSIQGSVPYGPGLRRCP
jgi:hypothetical protein